MRMVNLGELPTHLLVMIRGHTAIIAADGIIYGTNRVLMPSRGQSFFFLLTNRLNQTYYILYILSVL